MSELENKIKELNSQISELEKQKEKLNDELKAVEKAKAQSKNSILKLQKATKEKLKVFETDILSLISDYNSCAKKGHIAKRIAYVIVNDEDSFAEGEEIPENWLPGYGYGYPLLTTTSEGSGWFPSMHNC